jgi:hypothetical protein
LQKSWQDNCFKNSRFVRRDGSAFVNCLRQNVERQNAECQMPNGKCPTFKVGVKMTNSNYQRKADDRIAE